MALPSAVTFGTVVAKFLIATADSPDDSDRDPEGNPATGLSVTFSPSLDKPIARLPSASPPVIFAIADVPATIGSDGTLRGSDGQPGVKLVAGMNPLLDPYGWPWQVTISGTGFPKLSFSFALGGGDSVDLASVVQVPAAPGQTLAQWLGAVTDAQAARDAASASAAATAELLAAASTTYVALRGAWTANTAYPKNSLVIQGGAVYLAAADVPSRTVFTASDWQALGGASSSFTITPVGNGLATITPIGSATFTDSGNGIAALAGGTFTDLGNGLAAVA